MPTLLLIRHGRTTANATGTLAGWTPGIELDETGQDQAARLAERLAELPVCRVLSSPLERTVATASPLAQRWGVPLEECVDLGECRYGGWTGRALSELSREELWRTVQQAPSAASFPPSADFEHESIAAMSARAVAAVRELDAQVRDAHGAGALWAAVSHGDVIKAVLAEALGMHLDAFQRIVVDPASVSVIRYTRGRPSVLTVNGSGRDLSALAAPPADPEGEEAAVGGGGGPGQVPGSGSDSADRNRV